LNQFPPTAEDSFEPGFQDPFEKPEIQPEPPIQSQMPEPPAPPTPPVPPAPPMEPTEFHAPPAQEPVAAAQEDIQGLQKEELTKKIEDKLTLAIKEILWEIAPPLAEKLIKEEINRIKAEIEKPIE
jgi:hypothetical protein